MSYLDVEKQLNAITDGLEQTLLSAKAIDTQGNVINAKQFDQIMNEAIKQCLYISRDLEKQRYDANSANVTQSRISWLKSIQEARSFKPKSNKVDDGREEKIIADMNEKKQKESALARIFGAIKNIGRKQTPPMGSQQTYSK